MTNNVPGRLRDFEKTVYAAWARWIDLRAEADRLDPRKWGEPSLRRAAFEARFQPPPSYSFAWPWTLATQRREAKRQNDIKWAVHEAIAEEQHKAAYSRALDARAHYAALYHTLILTADLWRQSSYRRIAYHNEQAKQARGHLQAGPGWVYDPHIDPTRDPEVIDPTYRPIGRAS